MKDYLGHDSQAYGIEEHRLVGGKGDGMRLLLVRNGRGLDFTVSPDRCCDISRLSFRGINMGYFSPCGYVAPAFYDCQGDGFLKSFTAGFLTTCGLTAVGAPCVDEGESLPLHGTIANTPAEQVWWEEREKELLIHGVVKDERIFAHKLVLYRELVCSTQQNLLMIHDRIVNRGDTDCPAMILYHMNMGYPLLSEHARLEIPAEQVTARNEHAAEDLATWDQVLKPQAGFEEQCYYHKFRENGRARICNEELKMGLEIRFDPRQLPFFTQWKMMGQRDYVMGLEPGNCHPDGRDKMRRDGDLTILKPGEERQFDVEVELLAF